MLLAWFGSFRWYLGLHDLEIISNCKDLDCYCEVNFDRNFYTIFLIFIAKSISEIMVTLWRGFCRDLYQDVLLSLWNMMCRPGQLNSTTAFELNCILTHFFLNKYCVPCDLKFAVVYVVISIKSRLIVQPYFELSERCYRNKFPLPYLLWV